MFLNFYRSLEIHLHEKTEHVYRFDKKDWQKELILLKLINLNVFLRDEYIFYQTKYPELTLNLFLFFP